MVALVVLAVAWWFLKTGERQMAPPLGKPITSAPIKDSACYDKHWRFGTPEAENVVCRQTYLLGFPDRGGLARWVAFKISPGKCIPKDYKDPNINAPVYDHRIEGYAKATLVPPRLVGGYDKADQQTGFKTLNVPMTAAMRKTWNKLNTSDYTHMLTGPFLNEKLPMDRSVVIPNRYFVILFKQGKREAYWLANDSGIKTRTDIDDIEQKTGLTFFEKEIQ